MCLYPRLIQNKKYTKTKKNGGVIPPIFDNRVLAVPIGCGNCMECRKQEARKWHVRMLEDIKKHTNGKFVTLTFSNESIKELVKDIEIKERSNREQGYAMDNEIATLAVRRFLERWRKQHKKSVRHWLITELGHNGTENIHLHGIIWTNESMEEIREKWKYGYVWPRKGDRPSYVNGKTVSYITKYVTKRDKDHREYKSKIMCSAGIGRNYVDGNRVAQNKFKGKDTNEAYKTESGHKLSLPVYYRNHIYTEEERERLWINKLDEGKRYVDGTEIKAGEEERYYKLLEQARAKNKRLGYGTDTKDWNRKRYEEERRKWQLSRRLEE